ncbi:MAG: class I SAM-dependent methyltransferase [Rhodospirillales bacterium]|nr:class I SAM-dependent methyltransferase [Rhodospirillales bacterium]
MTDFSEQTRAIYHQQHMRVASDQRAMDRFINMFSEEYFGVPQGFFDNKKVLDAGCGDTVKLLIALYRLGCRDLHGVDLGDDFIPVAQESLDCQGVPKQAVHLGSATVLDLPYETGAFDFVSCHGVLLHLNNLGEVRQAFRELARVTKQGGVLYTVYGVVGGLLEEAIFPAVREHYRNNANFRAFIDTISPEHFAHLINLVEGGIREYEGEHVDLTWLHHAMDVDLAVTIQNIIQAPVRLTVDEAMIRDMYAEAGFEPPRRLKRYVKRRNIRRFAVPLHFFREDEMVSLIYGSGNLEFIAIKT